MADGPIKFDLMSGWTGNPIAITVGGRTIFVVDQGGNATLGGGLTLAGDLVNTQSGPPTVGSGGSGVSALSLVGGSTNLAGGVTATLTAVAVGVVVGVVSFATTQASAPRFVICSLAAPTAGVAAPPIVGADTYTTSGFTIRSYGPTTVTTGTYVINYAVFF
jgi:hypothetical protein